MGSLRLEILEEIFFKDVADARNQSSDLNGFRRIFLVATLEILGEIFNNKIWPGARNYYGSTEDTEGTDG